MLRVYLNWARQRNLFIKYIGPSPNKDPTLEKLREKLFLLAMPNLF